jgi:hypothetical protein
MTNTDISTTNPMVPAWAEAKVLSSDITGESGGKRRPQTYLMAMIVCLNCKHMVYSPADYLECERLLNGGRISRHCHKCEAGTNWVQFEWHMPDDTPPLLFQTAQPDPI